MKRILISILATSVATSTFAFSCSSLQEVIYRERKANPDAIVLAGQFSLTKMGVFGNDGENFKSVVSEVKHWGTDRSIYNFSGEVFQGNKVFVAADQEVEILRNCTWDEWGCSALPKTESSYIMLAKETDSGFSATTINCTGILDDRPEMRIYIGLPIAGQSHPQGGSLGYFKKLFSRN